jgi:hypothetical protein
MIQPGDIISYSEMCIAEGISLQKGMNYKIRGGTSVILMSTRKGAPYSDRTENNGQILIYEGHDVDKKKDLKESPKSIDQPLKLKNGKLTANGKFFQAAENYKKGNPSEHVRVYEKIKSGIWVYNGTFELIDAWVEKSEKENRNVFKFKLQIIDVPKDSTVLHNDSIDLEHNRLIPTSVKLEVWKRDKGQCVKCGSKDNLHFDHILPFSKGGTSLKAENIQLLCARHNLQKNDKIQ